MVETYWNIGKYIIEFEQKGKIKAEYGKKLLLRLSKDLKLRLGKGYSRSNLYNMRKLYELYPIFQPLAGKLSWTNLCEILTINDEMERNFYIAEASKEKWSKRTLKRQMESGLFLKLAVSKNKNEKGHSIAEFMIIPKYRRLKIGKRVAIDIFNLHNGVWEVKPSYRSKSAFAFWKNVIDEYTEKNNTYEDGIFVFQSK